ncbi:MAG: deoxyribodipyrimidine photo-lyase [Polyangia bacterium]
MTAAGPGKSPGQAAYGLHWFRRDLRVAGNPALRWAWSQHGGRVLGIFCFDAQFLARPDFSADRFAFFLATLKELRDELRACGGDLWVADRVPLDAFASLVQKLDDAGIRRPATVTFNRDYEPFARRRDEAVTTLLRDSLGIPVHTESDHLLIEPEELRKETAGKNDTHYFQVYSAFARRWFELLGSARVRARVAAQEQGLAYLERPERQRRGHGNDSLATPFALTWPALFFNDAHAHAHAAPPEDHLDRFIAANAPRVRVPLPPAGSGAALQRLKTFAAQHLSSYKVERDLPGIDATSRLSIYLKNGSFTAAQVIAHLKLGDATFGEGSGRSSFLREIVWREFYTHVLWHRPDVETRAFLPQFRDLAWENRPDWFEAWKAGRTGYPIVDAGMRQLAETGWMHNRVRMIVASFLTKDLLIDWRWGERYFMERLLDGDLAPNNGGWQWAASTGCDPQPYFRIFNPTLQSKRFDPAGGYLRQFLPERRTDDDRNIHQPRTPIVEHAIQKEKALALYRGQGQAKQGG